MKQRTIIILVIAAIAISAVSYQIFFKKEKADFSLVKVARGNVSQTVSETGQVQKGDKINLGFKSSGRIESIVVEKGKNVEQGEILAKLDSVQLQVQLQEAKSAATAAKAQLDKLLAGKSQEEIKVKQTEVSNKQTALDEATESLDAAYDDSLISLDDAYLKAYNAKNVADSVQRTYFDISDQESLNVKEEKDKIIVAVSQIKSSLDKAKTDTAKSNIDASLFEVKNKLSGISESLKNIRELCEAPLYQSEVSSTDKSSLDTQRTNINTVIADIVNSQQTAASAKLDVAAAEGNLQSAEDELNLVLAPARQEDKDLYASQLAESEAKVRILEVQIQDVYLRSPVKGQIVEIQKRAGEITQSQDVIFILLPAVPFDIRINIYEEDVVKINIGNPVDISLIALPGQIFQGRVAAINPAEEIVDGVVYYEIIIVFDTLTSIDNMPKTIKPGMTADVVIKTASKENVLVLPEEAIDKKDGKTTVYILKNKIQEEKEIQTGLWGSDGKVEALSGLEEGESVVIFP